MNSEKLRRPRIIVAGHTSAGKTTLIRTLIKSPIGEIGAEANVTKTTKEEYYDGLQATFVDSPGFQNAGKLRTYIDNQLDVKKDSSLIYDILALEALKEPDAALYVADLSVTPDAGHIDEIILAYSAQRNIVAVLNKNGKQRATKDKHTLIREKEWKDALKSNGVKHTISFDAHFDKPSKVYDIYDALQKTLPKNKAILFKNGIEMFEKRQEKIREEAFTFLYKTINKCRGISVIIDSSKLGYSEEEANSALRESLAKQIEEASVEFSKDVSSLYTFVANNPLTSGDELEHILRQETKVIHLLKENATHVGLFGGIASTLGAAIGALMTGVVTGGLGPAAGATLGAQWGGSLGSAFGLLTGTFTSVGGEYTGSLSSEQIKLVTCQCIAVIWGLSNHGYGKSDEITAEQINSWGKYVGDIDYLKLSSDWQNANKSELKTYFEEAICVLERNY